MCGCVCACDCGCGWPLLGYCGWHVGDYTLIGVGIGVDVGDRDVGTKIVKNVP